MDTWSLVQSLAMNPRIRTTVELQKPLSMLLAFLENRWQSENRKLVSFLTKLISFNYICIYNLSEKNFYFIQWYLFKQNVLKFNINSVNKYIELKHLKSIKNLKEF